jgi:hypothetical protein
MANNLTDKARRQWQSIGNQTGKKSITPEMVNDAGKATVDAVEFAMPYIGSNGNWWISGEDTGHKAQGEKGETAIPSAVDILNALENVDLSKNQISLGGHLIIGNNHTYINDTDALLMDDRFGIHDTAFYLGDMNSLSVILMNATDEIHVNSNNIMSLLAKSLRLLKLKTDNSAVMVGDFENLLLNDSDGIKSVDWDDRMLYDRGGRNTEAKELSIDWDERTLYDYEGRPVLEYSNGSSTESDILNVYNAGIQYLDRNHNIYSCIDFYNGLTLQSESNVIDIKNGYFEDTHGTSVDFNNRRLYSADGDELINWHSGLAFWGESGYSEQPAAIANVADASNIPRTVNLILGVLRTYGLIASE